MKYTRKKLISVYLDFFKSKKHKIIENASLIPKDDPTVLFTTAGMQPLVPYLLGQTHPQGRRLVNNQRCVRTVDIEEVGDTYHHTFFEMLGNWSLGDYWKKEAIEMSFEFFTKTLKIPKERLAVTCFKGDKNGPKDAESEKVWLSLGIPKQRIIFLPKEDNWWGPTGKTGPCGPCTEIFYWKADDRKPAEKFDPKDERWVEIGNDVLMQYNKDSKGNYNPAKQKNIDFGGGVERTLAVLQGYDDNYLTECWQPIIKKIEQISKREYDNSSYKPKMRIIADHIKASAFIIADGITPGKVEQAYVLRRLIRRAIRYGKELGIDKNFTKQIAEPVFKIYPDYKHLQKNKKQILEELEKEEKRFRASLESGLRLFEKVRLKLEQNKSKIIDGKTSFLLYQSYGFPLEMTQELAKQYNLKVDVVGFNQETQKHQKLSRTASVGRFKSGLADTSKETTKLHTSTHLLLAALKQVLGKQIQQKGSNIRPERLRFDFNFDRKLTNKEVHEVEKIVNKNIQAGLEVKREEMTLKQAKKQRAEGIFEHKYKGKVSVYTIKDKKGKIISKEICAGPHISNTKQLGKFKIIKEESVAAGVRRIKAILE